MGNVRSLALDKLGPLMSTHQEYQEGNTVSHWDMTAGSTPLHSTLRLRGQTETADRVVTVKENDGEQQMV